MPLKLELGKRRGSGCILKAKDPTPNPKFKIKILIKLSIFRFWAVPAFPAKTGWKGRMIPNLNALQP